MKSDPFDHAVTKLYDAAADPALWSSALQSAARLHGGDAMMLQVCRDPAQPPDFALQHGIDPAVERLYVDHYVRLDPPRQLVPRLPDGHVLACHDHFDNDFVRRNEYYSDFLIPSGGRYLLGLRMIDSVGRSVLIGIHHNARQGAFETAHRTTLTRLAPHLRWAVEMQRRLAPLHRGRALAEQAFDALASPTIVVEGSWRVLLMNRAADALCREGDGLTLRGGRLVIDDPAAQTRLRRALHAAFACARGKGTGGATALAVTRPSGRAAYALIVMPLGERSPAAPTGPALIIQIVDPERRASVDQAALRQLFGLTPAEADLARALLQGRRLAELAGERRVSLATVRTQLQAVFAKTETRRQADLVRLLGALVAVRNGEDEAAG
ncbi:helix-turn-helix transcriptional regulator [Marinivivus vitaminiproducens]|uniref:helix-turn-helix transcriptional regulator n=1 Tax=Marinivivus vitaminiproducens TaxID=3035935 RepID=UPI0027A7F0A0|nr:helix-turn-helix transcriptional regulator [Geminicoccaceae bacterium SCSIO 64248]